MIGGIAFQNPWLLLLLALLPPIVWQYAVRRYRRTALLFSSVETARSTPQGWKVKLRHLPFALRIFALTLFVIAIARPQAGTTHEMVASEGIDIMLVLDISGSMRAEDFEPKNRLEAAKQVISDFIKGRKGDRIGLVLFSRRAFTQCPLTLDYGVLIDFLERAHFGQIQDGTAIGMAIATGADRLKESKAKSKVMVLLTDGINNAGNIAPITAAKLAKALDIKIHAVGVGKKGMSLYPVDDPIFGRRYVPMQNELDEESLTQVAQATGGTYHRATDTTSLATIYQQIDKMEKTKVEIETTIEYREMFWPFLIAGVIALLLEVVLASSIFRRIA